MKNYIITITLLLLFITSLANAHDSSTIMGVIVSSPLSYDRVNKSTQQGLSVHAIYWLFNLSYEHSSLIFGKENRMKAFAGIGIVNFMQIQYGNLSVLRFRNDIVLFSSESTAFDYWDNKWGPFRKGIVVTPLIDYDLTNKSFSYGIAFGVYF